MGSDTAMVRTNDLAGGTGAAGAPMAGGTDMAGSSIGADQDVGGHSSAAGMGTTGIEDGRGTSWSSTGRDPTMGSGTAMGGSVGSASTMERDTGTAGMVGSMQSAGNTGGDRDDVIDALQDLVECCKDGEYGFRTSAEQVKRQDLKSTFQQRAEDCRRGADELNAKIRSLGGKAEDSGSAMGAMHRGWVSVKSTLSTYDDKAVLEECERGEDNAKARYRKALKQQLPADVQELVQRQMQGVERNHDQIKMLRDQLRAAGDSASNMGATGSGSGMGNTITASGGTGSSMGASGATGAAGMVGSMQSAGNTGGDRKDVIDALQDLVECCKDGEYGFRTSAEQAKSSELKSVFQQRADECRRGADELNQQIRSLGGSTEDSGSAMGAVHRGWVAVKATLSTYDDKAVLEECERGEDNAVARYRKALKQQLPDQVRQVVERQSQAVQRNHDQVKRLRDQYRQQ
ncbi:ferritin-like domain-containing protein [Ramlibacter sp. MMS24-I3-19]|uniref:ferritin-like domain-containing protein n=1 Tax=Ramlibacter sp. MMS24-I3-19 TaxID=3416606 RepID=UPI003CFF787E